ncbi:thymidine phosphorylase [bacterium]|nr:thymidine phosphorylase [bacterium]MBU1984574.1 thymidine phosphorylase [bacterium]
MLTVELIAKKQRGEELTREEIATVIRDFTEGAVPDYQMAALLMAIYFQGLSDDEGRTFLRAMVGSGIRLTLSSVNGIKVDKHSTGGVGDKTSLIVAPVVAAAGVPVPMISGRALGHTGGTLDKLESIPGFHVNLEEDEFENVLRETGCAFGAQTEAIVPADRKLYALRDVTATVSIPPLIAASILSKKIAEGADALVMDVKVGSGGFLRSEEEARQLAEMIVRWSAAEGIKTVVFGTDMDQPLGRAAGNAPEVLECIQILRTGKGEARLLSVCRWLGAAMLLLGEKANTFGEAVKLFDATLSSGAGLVKLSEIAAAQGSNAHTVEHFEQHWKPAHRHEIRAGRNGFVQSIAAREVGYALVDLGAGRRKATDRVDHSAGVWFEKQVGDEVKEGELVATAHWSGNDSSQAGLMRLQRAIRIADAAPVAAPLFKFFCDEGGVRMTDDILSGT